jgi:hypothetical protein
MFLDIEYPQDLNVERTANIIKFTDCIQELVPKWDNNWILYEIDNSKVTFQNKDGSHLSVILNSNFKTFSMLLEFDKYKMTQINFLEIDIDVNELSDFRNNVRFIGTKILNLQLHANQKSLDNIKLKYKIR